MKKYYTCISVNQKNSKCKDTVHQLHLFIYYIIYLYVTQPL